MRRARFQSGAWLQADHCQILHLLCTSTSPSPNRQTSPETFDMWLEMTTGAKPLWLAVFIHVKDIPFCSRADRTKPLSSCYGTSPCRVRQLRQGVFPSGSLRTSHINMQSRQIVGSEVVGTSMSAYCSTYESLRVLNLVSRYLDLGG